MIELVPNLILTQIFRYLNLTNIISCQKAFNRENIRLPFCIQDISSNSQITLINSENVEFIEHIIKFGSGIFSEYTYDFQEFLNVETCTNYPNFVKYLLVLGVSPNVYIVDWCPSVDLSGKVNNHSGLLFAQLLTQLVDLGNIEMVKILLEHGADPNVFVNNWVEPPLWTAIRHQNLEMIKLLLESGADPNYYLEYNDGPNYYLLKAYEKFLQKVEYDFLGSAIFLAITTKNLESVKLLIQAGSNLEQLDREGATPLLRAGILESVEIVQLLIDSGVKPKLDANLYYDPAIGNVICQRVSDWAKVHQINLEVKDN